jgi:saccharopine dehydrogenase-like NADP-dependent oxidoreductase
MSETRRIIVLGGTGCTGRLIVQDLLRHRPDDKVDAGARRPERSAGLPAGVGRVRVDWRDRETAGRLLAGYDLVILAVGPFEVVGDAAHRLCVDAGVDCLDINDSLPAARAIFALDARAKEKGVRVLTGMGLSPGLTTLLMLDVLRRSARGRRTLRSRLFVGGKQDAGRSAIRAMLASFAAEVPVVRRGAYAAVPSDDGSPDSIFAFAPGDAPVKVLHYPTPEAWTLPAHLPDELRDVEEMDYRVHFQGIPMFFVKALRALPALRAHLSTSLISLPVHAIHDVMKRRKDEGVVVAAECAGPGGVVTAAAHAPSSYEATARFASAVAHLALEGGLAAGPGVHSFEMAGGDSSELRELLRRRGIHLS